MLSSPCTPYSFRGPEVKQKSKDLEQSYCKENERYCIDEKNSENGEDKEKEASKIGMIHIHSPRPVTTVINSQTQKKNKSWGLIT